ncbi:Down syndrome cell adhesion molecule-like protein Dscam2 [Nymphon striatum]|nr:Down syndrome cell adhesion molecule-like protein Dscam2 [Nymphon striatum]KAG1671047.1 Down syndrome cell adhesion molecule-like protein Dscam2 [Nymphon striatum]
MTETGNLLITDVTDSGTLDLGYWCQVKNKMFGETFLSQTAGKIIRTDSQGGVGPVITEILDQISIEKFQDINLTCAAQGSPPPSFKWKFQKTGDIVSTHQVLSLKNLKRHGTFMYTCIAENRFGIDKRDTKVVVRSQIEVFIEPNIKVVDSGSKIKLECNANGYPIQKVKWILNGKSVKFGVKIKAISSGRTLEIVSANREHEGMYQCFVSNSWQEVQSTAQIVLGGYSNYVNIYGLPVVHELQNVTVAAGQDAVVRCFVSGHPIKNIVWERVAPKWIMKPIDVHEIIGGSATINCKAGGYPEPTIKWAKMKGRKVLTLLRNNNQQSVYPNGSLHFINIQKIDSGKYSCIASNGIGEDLVHEINLKIKDVPVITYINGSISVSKNQAISLQCNAVGTGTISIKWIFKNNVLEDNDKRITITRKEHENKIESILNINNAKENLGGIYHCRASNKNGHDEKQLTLRIKGSFENGETKSMNGTMHRKRSTPTSTLDRRYGRLERPLPMPRNDSKSNLQDEYEIPDYCLLSHFNCETENLLTGPVFIKEPSSVVEFLNTEGSHIHCAAHGEPHPEIRWFNQDGLVEKSSMKSIPSLVKIYSNGTLEFKRFSTEQFRQDIHSTVYICSASNLHGTITSSPVSVRAVTKQQQQQIQAQVYDEYVVAGNAAVLKCHIPAFYKDDLHVVAWIREDNVIINQENLDSTRKITETGNLLITEVSPEQPLNLGYWCQVKNKLTGDTFLSQTAGRIILTESQGGVGPVITDISEIVYVEKGQRVNLTCAGQGSPPPTYKWNIRTFNGGEYGCIAKNEVNSVIYTNKINVYGLPQVYDLQNVTVAAGQDAEIRCYVSGYPLQEIIWEKAGRFSNLPKNAEIEKDGTLIIKAARKKNSGKYTCLATNGRSQTSQKSTYIKVLTKPSLLGFEYQEMELDENEPFSAICSVNKGDEPIKIYWMKNNLTVILGHGTDIATTKMYSVLQIREVNGNDAGNYTCIARNEAGFDMRTVNLMVSETPKWHIEPKDVIGKIGGIVIINCKANGYPKPTIQWVKMKERHFDNDLKSLNGTINRKRGTPTSTYDRRYGKLEMPVTRNDSKSNVQEEYEIPDYWIVIICKCESNGKITGPIFIKEPTSGRVEFLSSEGIQFDCTAHGDPYPKIQWLKQDGFEQEKEVVKIPSLVEIHRNGTLGLKSFRPDQFRQDIHATVYRCSASNIHGRIISGPVSVRGTTKQQQQQIQAQVYDEYVVTGNTGVLKCHIPAFYKDDLNVVSWVREDNRVSPDVFMTHNGHLHINSVTAEMNLNLGYWCQVKNRITEETFLSQSAGRIILTDPQGGVAPVITDIMKTVSIERGKAVKLSCAAQGSPPPTYEWMLDTDNKVASRQYDTIGPLEVSIRPSLQIADSGSRFSLSCNVHGHPIIRIKWVMNGKTLVENDNVVISSNGTLNVLFSTRKDEGMYQCFASNDWEEVQSTAQVILGDLSPKLTQVFKSKTLQPGPSISLTCIASGRPSPTIKWMHNGRYLQKNDRYVFKERSTRNGTAHSKLIIKSLRASDGGEYTCIATNNVSNTSHTAKVNVYGLPVIHAIDNVTVAAEQDALIRCYVSGHPIINIHWERDDIFSNLPENMYSFNNGTLVMKSAQKSNSGHYSCIAQNGRGQEDKKSTFIKVLTKPILLGLKYELAQMEEGDPFSAMCSVFKGDEPIKITWKHNNKPIELKHGTDIATTKMYSVLQIRDAKEQQKGNYSCIAVNEAGYDTRTIELKLNLAPKWLIEPENGDASLEGSISLHCQASGNPPPSIKWVKVKGRNMKPITNKDSNKVLHINGTLFIKNVNHQDGGEYSCIASNGVGRKLVKMIILRIKNIPMIKFLSRSIYARYGQNVTIMCEVTGGKMISIQWVRENEIIQQNQERFDVKVEKNNNGLRSTLSITELVEDDSGKYVCSARNNHGDSKKHMQLTVMPNGNPNEFTKANVSPTQITQTSQTEIVLKKDNFQEKSQKDAVNVENTANTEREIDNSLDKSEHELSQYDDHALAESKDPRFDLQNMNLKAVVFIVPAAAVVILLIAVIITIVVYLVIRNKNMKNKKNARRSKDYSGIDTLNRSVQGKNYDPTRSIDRRYGKLERPLPLPNCESDQEPYEIPDY